MEVLGLIIRKLCRHTKRRLSAGIRVCDSLEPRLLLTVSSEVILNLTDNESFSGDISDFTFGEDLAYFVTSTPTTGRELWKTDGTVDGTRIVADLALGVPSPDIRQIVTVGNVVFFTAELWPEAASLSDQRHLWRSDGTPEGTYVVQYEDGFSVRAPLRFVRWQDSLYVLHARMPNFEDQPFLSLYRVQADFGAKLELVSGSLPAASIDALNEFQLTATRDSLFLSAGSRVYALNVNSPGSVDVTTVDSWIDEVKSVGNRLLLSTRATQAMGSRWFLLDTGRDQAVMLPIPAGSTVLSAAEKSDGNILLAVRTSDSRAEFWESDGSVAGTGWKFSPEEFFFSHSADDSVRNVAPLADGRLMYTGGGSVWISDGTFDGTVRLTDPITLKVDEYYVLPLGDGVLVAGALPEQAGDGYSWYRVDTSGHAPRQLGSLGNNAHFAIHTAVAISGRVAFIRSSGRHQDVLMSDGRTMFTPIGAGVSTDGHSIIESLSESGAGILLTVGMQRQQFEFSGKRETTKPDPLFLTVLGTTTGNGDFGRNSRLELFFRESQSETWLPVISPIGGKQFSGVTPIAIAGSYFYFVERSSPGPGILWVTDGTIVGTHMVRDHSGPVSNVSRGVAMDGSRLLFSRLGPEGGSSVWVVDPFVLTASLLVDFRLVEVSKQPRFEAKINSGFLFVAADAIWNTDGTREGTKRLGDFDTNRMSLLSSSDSTAFFWREGPRMEVWYCNGSVAGFHMLTSLESEWRLTNPEARTFGDGLLLAYEGSLWFIRKGTFDLLLRKSPLSGILVTGTTGMSSAFGKVYFQSYDSILGDVLWETDATVSGTRIVRDSADQPVIRSALLSAPLSSDIKQLISFDGAIYYRGITDRYGIELVRLSSDVLEGVPAHLKVIRSKQHVLQWQGVFGAEDYEIELTDLNAVGGVPLVVRVPNNLWTIPTDWDGRSVSIRVRAVLPNGITGEWSSERLVVTLGEVPVLGPMVTPSLNPSPNISWTPVPGTMRTDVWISNLDTKRQIVSTSVTGRVTTYQPPDLPAGRYAVWVRSVADGGLTDWSEVRTFTVLSSPPSIIRIEVQQSGPLTIEWSAVPGANGYEVWVSRQGVGAAVRHAGNTGPALQWTFADALPGDSYTVWVRALRDGRAFSTWSPGSRFMVASAPVFRSLLPVLKWDAVRPAVAYQIRIQNETTGAVFSDRTTSTTLMTAANSPGRYRIFIRSEYSDGSTSDWRTAAQEILHPSVQFPTGVVSTVDATPVITWEAFSGVSNYDLEVYREDSGKRVYLSRGLLGITHRVASLLEAGEYRVWVRGQFADGTRTLWGNGQRLLIGSPPTLMYSSGKLSWSSASEATRYELEIVMWDSGKQRWDRVLRTDVRNQTEYSVSAFGQGRYRGWVRALRDEAGDSYFSRWSTAADWS